MRKFCLCILPLLLSNGIYFIWQPYIKHLLPFFGDYAVWSDLITNILFFTAYFCLIIIIANIGFCENQGIHGRRFCLTIASFMLIQVGFDLLKLIVARFSEHFLYIINDLCCMVSFLIFFRILFKMGGTTINYRQFRRISFCAVAACSALSIFLHQRNYAGFQYSVMKYQVHSFHLNKAQNNFSFQEQAISFIVETLFVFLVFTILFFKYSVKKENSKWNIHTAIKFSLQVALIILSAVFINFKILFLPISAFAGTQTLNSDISVNQIDDFYATDNYTVVYRNTSYDKKKPIFEYGNIDFYHAGQICLSTHLPFLPIFDADYDFGKSDLLSLNCIALGDFEFWQYGDLAILYDDGKEIVALKAKDIAFQKKNDRLIQICEKLIADGEWSYFEYSVDYLLKYDRNFIVPYINRYATESFSFHEKNLTENQDIRPEFIVALARKHL